MYNFYFLQSYVGICLRLFLCSFPHFELLAWAKREVFIWLLSGGNRIRAEFPGEDFVRLDNWKSKTCKCRQNSSGSYESVRESGNRNQPKKKTWIRRRRRWRQKQWEKEQTEMKKREWETVTEKMTKEVRRGKVNLGRLNAMFLFCFPLSSVPFKI